MGAPLDASATLTIRADGGRAVTNRFKHGQFAPFGSSAIWFGNLRFGRPIGRGFIGGRAGICSCRESGGLYLAGRPRIPHFNGMNIDVAIQVVFGALFVERLVGGYFPFRAKQNEKPSLCNELLRGKRLAVYDKCHMDFRSVVVYLSLTQIWST